MAEDSTDQAQPESDEEDSITWQWLAEEWPYEERPKILRDRKKVAQLTMTELTKMQKNYLLKKRIDEKAKARAKGAGKVTRDQPPKPITFLEETDDCKEKLHPARWQRTPLTDPSKWWPRTPRVRTDVFKAVPLKFMGADNSIANKTLERCHDRTDALLLKHFLSENCNITSRPKQEIRKLNDEGQVVSLTDDAWEAVSNISAAKEAFMNYSTVIYFLFPYDPTPMLLLRIMMRYNWISAVGDNPRQRTLLIESFFNSVLQQNANRAVNDEVVLSFNEMLDLLKNQLRSAHVTTEPPVSKDYASMKPKLQSQNQKQKQHNQPKGQPSSQRSKPSGSTVYMTADNKLTCYKWNRLDGTDCTQQPSDIGCMVNGNKYAHRCSAPNPNGPGICGKPHRRRDHK